MSTVQSIQRQLRQLEESLTTLANAQLSFNSDVGDLTSRVLQLALISVKRTKDGLFIVATCHAETRRLLFFVGHAVNEIDDL